LTEKEKTIAIIGLGYVGLPLAIVFSEKFTVIGFDINHGRVEDLKKNKDTTLECSEGELRNANIHFTSNIERIKKANVFIVTVPTPVDRENVPDFTHLESASKTVAYALSKGDYVIYESTVFPGATEEICLPILEKHSQMKCNKDFFIGYSPERINPGDKSKKIHEITKITSGSCEEASEYIDLLYSQVIKAGTHKASSIKVAEAAKVIENTQRDLNIALVNELSIIFSHLDIDTHEVLDAAATKWNFHHFVPGMVGGHCIGVDPYYLTYKSKQVGYEPKIILSGREMNDQMAIYYGDVISSKINKDKSNEEKKVLVLGMTFKENCPDFRNTKVIDLVRYLESKQMKVDIFDPYIEIDLIGKEFNLNLIDNIQPNYYDGIAITVAHDHFKRMGIEQIKSFGKDKVLIFDLKNIFPIHDGLIRI